MPARVMYQDQKIKELFRQKIQAKIEKERQQMHDRINKEVPSWLRWVIRPLADIRYNSVRARDEKQGKAGERNASFNFWLFLFKEWVVINDVVLEPAPDDFVQIDHVLIGPPGIYLIETKAWEGAFSGYKDNWKRKEGHSWVRCESPTKQNLRHKKLFLQWIGKKDLGASLNWESCVYTIVLFTHCHWLKTKDCSMPVFTNGTSLAWYLRRQGKNILLAPELVEKITMAVVSSP